MILLLSTFMCFFINSVFRFNRTVFILLSSVLVFLFVSFFIVFLGFEFLGLVFATVYVGGIVVMFLFLILIVDVRVENTQKLVFKSKDFFFTLIFSIFFTLIFSIFFIYNYCPILANNTTFFNFFNNVQVCFAKPTYLDELHHMGGMEDPVYEFAAKKPEVIYTKNYIFYLFLEKGVFNETIILSEAFLQQHGVLLCLAGLFLLVATIVAVILCLNIFD